MIATTTLISGCNGTEQEERTGPPKTVCRSLPTDQVISIAGGTFTMGAEPKYREEGPPKQVKVASFRMDAHEVTNAQFAAFVDATGYVSEAERPPARAAALPPELQSPGAAVFFEPDPDNPSWWRWTAGASWRHPLGPSSSIEGLEEHPVVNVSLADAQNYAAWKGGSLPTEQQWEYAARGGSQLPAVPVDKDGRMTANYYQGAFPARDLGIDGFTGSAPAGCFPANDFGLFDMIGNVWEWTKPDDGDDSAKATIKGGSFLCAANYCARYRPSARQLQERDLGTNHVGFRLVYN